MDYKISLSLWAEEDIDDTIEWYEKKSVGLGMRFYLEFRSYVSTLSYAPHAFPVKLEGTIRELPLKVFPYVILYEIFDDEVIVYRVFPTKQNPEGKLAD